MENTTGFFLSDNEIFELFVSDENPPLSKSSLFRLNTANGIVELQGIRGNILALRKLKQTANIIQVKLDSPTTAEVERRLQALGFARCNLSTRAGFVEFQEAVKLPAGYTQQCDRINIIWKSWWPIKDKTINGQSAVLLLHEGKWHEVKEVEIGVAPTIATKTQYLKMPLNTEITWAIDSRFAKGTKVEERIKYAHTSYADERSWAQETVLSGSKSTLTQVMKEITASSQKWIENINSIDTDLSGLLDESNAIDQRKRNILKALEYLVKIGKEG